MITLQRAGGLFFLLFMCMPACGTSASVFDAQEAGTNPSDAGPAAVLKQPCSGNTSCPTDLCLHRVGADGKATGGVCSSKCIQSSDCGAQATCVQGIRVSDPDGGVSLFDGGACIQVCSASTDCAPGILCIWNATLDAGVCQPPLGASFCAGIGDAGSCEACLGVNCCDDVVACAEDVACAKLEKSPAPDAGNAKSGAVAACAMAKCASACK